MLNMRMVYYMGAWHAVNIINTKTYCERDEYDGRVYTYISHIYTDLDGDGVFRWLDMDKIRNFY